MAIAHIQSRASRAAAALNVALAYSSNLTVGSLLVVAGSSFNDTITIADSKVQAWTRDLSAIQAADAGFCMGHFPNTASGADTVTLTRASATTGDISIAIAEYSGATSAGTQDGTAGTAGTTGATNSASTSLILTDAGSVVLSGIANDLATGTPTVTSSFTLRIQAPSPWDSVNMNVAIAERLPGVTGTYSTTWGGLHSVTGASMVGIIGFKPVATTPFIFQSDPMWPHRAM